MARSHRSLVVEQAARVSDHAGRNYRQRVHRAGGHRVGDRAALLLGQIESIGANIVYARYDVNPDQPVVMSNEITVADMDAVKAAIPNVVAVAGTRSVRTTVVTGSTTRNIALVGATEGFQFIRNLVVTDGRYLDSADISARSKVCLITQDLADVAFPNQDPVGQKVRVGEVAYTVVGVFKERVATFGLSEIQQYSLLVPFPLMRNYTGDDAMDLLYAQAAAPEDVPALTNLVEDMLRTRHPSGTYIVLNLGGILDAARSVSTALTIVLLLVGLIALIVSGIGIMNIMLVTVTERTREIGIRKAIGARHREILYQFLIEAILISGIGSILGILIAVAIPVAVRPLLPGNLAVPVPVMSVVLAFVVACSTGLFFGYLPANKAARLLPTESLRYE